MALRNTLDNNLNNDSIKPTHVLPDTPYQIDVDDLTNDFCLITEEKLAEIKERFPNDGRYHKKETGLSFVLIVKKGQYFGIYPAKVPLEYLLKHNLISEDNYRSTIQNFSVDGEYEVKYDNISYWLIIKEAKHYIRLDERMLGAGSFATVKLLQNLESRRWEAIKTIEEFFNQELIDKEVKLLTHLNLALKIENELMTPRAGNEYDRNKKINNPHFSLFKKSQKNKSAKLQFTIPMARASGIEFFKFIVGRKIGTQYYYVKLSAILILEFAQNLLNNIKAIHDRGIVHRDLKPENLVYHPLTNTVTITDFGLADFMDNGACVTSIRCGSQEYAPPEIIAIQNSYRYGFNTDVYSFGLMVGFLTKVLYLNQTTKEFEFNNRSRAINFKVINSVTSAEQMYDLIVSVCANNPNDRPNYDNINKALQSIKDQLDDKDRLIKVILVDIDEYLSLTNDERTHYLQMLFKYQQIYLISTTQQSEKTLVKLRQQLTSYGFAVYPEVYPAKTVEEFEALGTQLMRNQMQKFNDRSFKYFRFEMPTANKKLIKVITLCENEHQKNNNNNITQGFGQIPTCVLYPPGSTTPQTIIRPNTPRKSC